MSSRTEQYNEAKTNWETARQAMTTGETARIRRDAAEDVEFAVRLYREGGLKPVIDRTYGLDEVVEGHRYVDTGRKRGSVVLRVADATAGLHRRQASPELAVARPS